MVALITKRSSLLLPAIMLAACVTTSSKPQAPASKKEAAQFNLQLGVTYLRQGELKTAQDKLEKAISQDGSLATAYSALGLVFERLGDNAGAERNYRTAVNLRPSDPDTLNALAVFLCQQKKEPVEALRLFDKALAVPLSQVFANRAMINANAGVCAKGVDMELAEKYLRAALAADPNYRDVLLQLADVTYSRGNYLQTRGFIERYLAANRATPDALWLGVRAEQALGERQAAQRYGALLKDKFPTSEQTRLLLESERDGG